MRSRLNPEQKGVDDSVLNRADQQMIRTLVGSLPDEPLSMAWRSSLNEQLLAVAAKQQKKRRFLWLASPIAGVSLATALAVIVLFQPSHHQTPVIPDRGIEAAILTDHHTTNVLNEVSSAGLNVNEVSSDANDPDSEDSDWSEADVQSL